MLVTVLKPVSTSETFRLKAVTETFVRLILQYHLRTSMASFGDILTHDAAVDLIKSGDTDGDGFLNFVEFTVVLRDILLE